MQTSDQKEFFSVLSFSVKNFSRKKSFWDLVLRLLVAILETLFLKRGQEGQNLFLLFPGLGKPRHGFFEFLQKTAQIPHTEKENKQRFVLLSLFSGKKFLESPRRGEGLDS
jgi:hypothetical protein